MKNLLYIFKQRNTLILLFVLFFTSNLNAQTRSWLGTVNNDWKTSGNWADNIVPDKNIDVIIESSCTYYPDINYIGDSCKSVLIKDGAIFNLTAGGDLTVIGDFIVGEGNSGALNGEYGTLNITGNLILNDSSSLSITDCNISCTQALLNQTSTVTYNGSDMIINNWNYGNLVLNGTGIMEVTGDTGTPTISNNLTINNTGNVLKIPENKAITVNGTLTNNVGSNGIVIESGPLGDGSLISSTANVNATVKRYITGNQWHYLSSPIDVAPTSLFNTNNLLWWDASTEWTGTGDYNPWKGYSSTNLENAKGYAYYYYEDTIEFQGNINAADYTVTLYKSATGTSDYQGWNLIGNPYTSVLDWDALVSDGAVPVGAEDAIYFFDDDAGDGSQSNYRYYVPSTGGTYGVGTADASGKIPMGQAFFVKTNTDNLNLTFKKTYRKHNTQAFYKSKSLEIIKLKLTGNNISDELIFRIVPDASFGYDVHFDANKLFAADENIPQIYTFIPEKNEKIAINSIPEINEYTELNIAFKASAGTYDLTFDDITIPSKNIFLYDNLLKQFIDIKKNEKYTFSHDGGETTNRFKLVFKESESSSIEDYNNNSIVIYPNPAKDFISVGISQNEFPEGQIQILSITGQICYSSDLKNNSVKIDISNFSDGMYFLEIINGNNEMKSQKFIIKK